ncbi:hypothetical protein WQ54_15855 [Bacillus sp. SA1-12]|uniref:hypothetical protein n=1 Tax=Bacillus sp. SA1-12 TaxID=1455638 RepID=UPI0006274465|nr:hypothetical protein [Bacillus sp. SA1-12]KKI91244.1 hypothetical protein WQ54_15855 [Bacillus sp. SA1-12]
MQFDRQRDIKITTLFWIALFGLFLTTVYSGIIVNQGLRTMRKIDFIYYRNKKEAEREMKP